MTQVQIPIVDALGVLRTTRASHDLVLVELEIALGVTLGAGVELAEDEGLVPHPGKAPTYTSTCSQSAPTPPASVSRAGRFRRRRPPGRLVLHPDGSIDADASDARRGTVATDPSKQRPVRTPERPSPASPKLKPVPNAAVVAVGDTLREHGLSPPSGGGATFLQAKTSNEVLKSQAASAEAAKLKGELVDRARAEALVFRLARETRDAWVNWPARAAALIAAELALDPAAMQKVLEAHVRAHLDELAEVRLDLG